MTRRILLSLVALVGTGVILLAAAATPASAQTGFQFPFAFNFAGLFQSIYNIIPQAFQSFVGSLFGSLLQFFTGGCAPFCAS